MLAPLVPSGNIRFLKHPLFLHNRLQLVIMSINYKHTGDAHQINLKKDEINLIYEKKNVLN